MRGPRVFGSPPPMSSCHRNLEPLGGGMRQYNRKHTFTLYLGLSDLGSSGNTVTKASTDNDDDSPSTELRDDAWVIPLIILAGVGIVITVIFEIYLMSKIIGKLLQIFLYRQKKRIETGCLKASFPIMLYLESCRKRNTVDINYSYLDMLKATMMVSGAHQSHDNETGDPNPSV